MGASSRSTSLPLTRPDVHRCLRAMAADEALPVLLENRRAFLGYLERHVGDRAVAEDILQDAFVKVVARPSIAPAEGSVVPWFYRILRNAVIDRFRREKSAGHAIESFARELGSRREPSQEIEAEICACVGRLSATLKPEYASALRAIDVDGMSVKDFAEQEGLRPGSARVRIFRARAALRKRVMESCGVCAKHGCLNCTCQHDVKGHIGCVPE